MKPTDPQRGVSGRPDASLRPSGDNGSSSSKPIEIGGGARPAPNVTHAGHNVPFSAPTGNRFIPPPRAPLTRPSIPSKEPPKIDMLPPSFIDKDEDAFALAAGGTNTVTPIVGGNNPSPSSSQSGVNATGMWLTYRLLN